MIFLSDLLLEKQAIIFMVNSTDINRKAAFELILSIYSIICNTESPCCC
jgi:hypothetical protein